MPLPLQTERRPIELVRIRRRLDRVGTRDRWFLMPKNRLARPVTVGVAAYHRESVLPNGGLQVENSPVRSAVLKMYKPPLASVRGIHERSLVRAVHAGFSLREHDLLFIRTVKVFRPEHQLPTRRD